MYVLVRHAFSKKLDLSTSVFGELCRLVLKLWILTTPGVPLPLIAAVPQVDAGPWRWGVVGVWYMFMYIWRAFIYLSCIKLKQWFQFPQVLRPFHMFLPALYKWLKHILSLAKLWADIAFLHIRIKNIHVYYTCTKIFNSSMVKFQSIRLFW